jgi:hypothetical protein
VLTANLLNPLPMFMNGARKTLFDYIKGEFEGVGLHVFLPFARDLIAVSFKF